EEGELEIAERRASRRAELLAINSASSAPSVKDYWDLQTDIYIAKIARANHDHTIAFENAMVRQIVPCRNGELLRIATAANLAVGFGVDRVPICSQILERAD